MHVSEQDLYLGYVFFCLKFTIQVPYTLCIQQKKHKKTFKKQRSKVVHDFDNALINQDTQKAM